MRADALKARMRALRERWAALLPVRRAGAARCATLAAVTGTLLLLGYLGYGEHQKRTVPRTVSALVHDASVRLHDALLGGKDLLPGFGRSLEAHYAAVNAHLAKLRAMDTSMVEEFARAADDYLLTTREILRRGAADHRNRMDVSESLRLLHTHMLSDNRTASWVTHAVQKKARLEAAYREYRRTAEALSSLLAHYPASHARMRSHLDSPLLIDVNLATTARRRTLDALIAMKTEVEQASELRAYRRGTHVGAAQSR